jgi:hypothetical protein
MGALEHLIRRFGTQVRHNGVLCLCSNGDPALVAAFAELGWPDPCPIDGPPVAPVLEAAVVEAPERAVLPKPKGRLG